jgi:lipopolysaccharide export system permease protein
LSTLSRYVLKEHLGPFLLGFALIMFVLLMDVILQMMDQVLSKGLSTWLATQLLFYNLAWITALAVPMAVLIAVLMAFARLAADSEIMAAKACGMGFGQLLRPVLVAAAGLTVTMILFNDLVLPDWNHRARNLTTSLRRRKAALALKGMEGLVIHGLGSYSLLVREVDEEAGALLGITVYDTHRAGPPTTLHAPRGRIQLLGDGSYMRLTLEDGELMRFDEADPERFLRMAFARQEIHIRDPDRAFKRRDSSYRSDREMDVGAMWEAVQKRRSEQRRSIADMDSAVYAYLRQVEAAMASDTLVALDSETSRVRSDLERHQRLNDNRLKRINQFQVEIHKKFSIPVACIVFVLVGAPLGVVIRRRGVAVSIGISLVFFWVYWMFLIGGEELADRGFMGPGLSMWAPNLVFGLLGLHLSRMTALDRPWFARSFGGGAR